LVVIARVLMALNKLRIPYMIVGALSSNLYGEPRQTDDAGLVVELGDTPISKVALQLGPDFRLDTQLGFETVTGNTRYHLHHVESEFLIELFQLTSDPHNQSRFSRRRSILFANVPAAVQSAEDVVIQKLRWYKRGHRNKDLEDARNVIDTQGAALDLSYMKYWTDRHETHELLETLMRERL
jgi:hypothetical protein